jgi:hypothetical protein
MRAYVEQQHHGLIRERKEQTSTTYCLHITHKTTEFHIGKTKLEPSQNEQESWKLHRWMDLMRSYVTAPVLPG